MIVLDGYTLGIIWSISSLSEDRIVFRHKDKYFLDTIKNKLNLKNTIYQQEARTQTQFVLKMSQNKILNELLELGYTTRNSEERSLPKTADRDFIKAYLEIHSSIDLQTAYRKKPYRDKYKKTRIRVYGNKKLIEQLNVLMHNIIGTGLKTPQSININDKTYYLCFSGRDDVKKILEEYEYDAEIYKPYWDKLGKLVSENR